MDRRRAVKSLALVMGATLSATMTLAILDGCNDGENSRTRVSYSEHEKTTISRMTDMIIPRTDTPGAVDEKVPEFILMILNDCYPEGFRKQFKGGLISFDKYCTQEYGEVFVRLSEDKQTLAMEDIEQMALKTDQLKQYFIFYRTVKELTLLGFFTSESGATKNLRYVQVPGEYDPCIPYKDGDGAWAAQMGWAVR